MSTNSEQHLVKALGTVMVSAAIINVIVGGGIFRLPSELSGNLGSASPTAFLLGALLIIPVTLCFAAVGSRVASTGGPYSYLHASHGAGAGFVAGALMWLGNLASSAGIATALIEIVALGMPQLAGGAPRYLALFALYASLTMLNLFGVAMGGRVLVALAALKLSPLILLVVIGIWFVDLGRIDWFAIPSLAALSSSMIAVIFAYSGIETALTPSGEVRDPARVVPRATLAATLIVVLLYVGIQVICQATLGDALAGDKTAVASAAGALWAPGKWLIVVTAAMSMSGFMMGNLLGSARMVYALGRDGYLPKPASHISRRGVPHVAVLTHAAICFGLACIGNFSFLIAVSSGANCLIYLAVALAAWKLQRQDVRLSQAPFQLPLNAWLVPLLAALAMIFVLSSLKLEEWRAITIALAILVAAYWLKSRRTGTNAGGQVA